MNMLMHSRLIEMLWSKLSTYEDLLLRIGPELDNVQRTEVQHALLSVRCLFVMPYSKLTNGSLLNSKMLKRTSSDSRGPKAGKVTVAIVTENL